MKSGTAIAMDWEEIALQIDPSEDCQQEDHLKLLLINRKLEKMSAEERVRWALDELPGAHVLSSSFGAQAAVGIRLLTQQAPDIPVILIDTGYLFEETYSFIDELSDKLKLNLNVFRAQHSPAWQEARHGKRWELGSEALAEYNQEVKVEPMKRALDTLKVGTWFVGLRRDQSPSRSRAPILQRSGERFKIHPIADWTDRLVHRYFSEHDLPYHPLWHKGFVSIGDHHTTRSVFEVDDPLETRFFGIKRECGLHEFDFAGD